MIRKNKKLISLILSTLLCSTIFTPTVTTYAETQNNGKMWYSNDSSGSYNIKGYYNGSLLQTTFSDWGYSTDIIVDGNRTNNIKFGSNPGTTNVNGIEITQNLSFVSGGNYVKIEYILRNTSGSGKTISLASHSDVMIGREDRAPINVLEDGRGFRMSDGSAQFMFIGKNSYGVTNVDTYWFGHYGSAGQCAFDQISSTSLSGVDSGMAYSWKNRYIGPGETQVYSVLIGIGAINNPPTLSLTSALKSQYFEGENVPITGYVNDTDAGDSVVIRYAIDNGVEYTIPGTFYPNGNAQAFNTNFTIPSNLAEGVHNLKVYAMDDKGNTSNAASVNFNVIKDHTPPTLTLSESNTNWTNGNVNINAAASDQYGINGIQTPNGWVAGANASIPVSANGVYSFTAYDTNGNPTTQTITVGNIDKVAPSTPTIDLNRNVLSIGNIGDDLSGVASVQYQINNGAWTNYVSPITLNDGNYTVNAKVVDRAGNVSTSTRNIVVDTTAPTLTLTESNTNWTNNDVTVNVASSDLNGVSSIETPTGVVQGSSVSFPVVGNGHYTFTATDNYGNKTTKSIDITNIDKVAPSTPTIDVDKDTLTLAGASDNLSGVQSFQYQINGGVWTNYTSPVKLNDGNYVINARTIDKAGNVTGNSLSILVYQQALTAATNALVKAEESKSITDVNIAQPLITALPSCPEKPILQNRLDVLKQYIVAESAVSVAEEVSTQANIDKAQTLVDALPVGSNKTYLQNRIDTIKNNILAMEKAKEAVKKAQQTYLQADLNNAQSLVSVLPDGLVKIDLQTTLDGIQDYINTMLRVSAAVEKAESTKNIIDVDNAQNEINNLVFGTFRTDLQNRLDVVKAYLKTISDATSAVEKAESTFSQTDVNNARNLVGSLTDVAIKTNLTDRLNAVQNQIDKVNSIVDSVVKAERSCSQVDVNSARNLVNTLEDGSLKTSLLDRLDKIQAYIDKVANATKAVDKAEISKTTDDINNAQSLIDILPEGDSNKLALQKRLDAIQQSAKAVSDVEKYVVKAEVSKSQTDIDIAQSKINTLPDGVEKTNLQNRLDAVKQYISNVTNATNAVIKAESSRSLEDINNAQDLINKLPDGATKTDLQNRLNAIKNIYNIIQNTIDAIKKAEGSMSQIDIDNAQSMINKLPDGPEKTELQNRLDQLKAKLSALANATAAVEKAEGSKLKVDVDAAQALVNVLPLGIDRTNLQKRLDAIVENTNAVANYTGLVEKAEKTKLQSDVTIAQNAVNTLPVGSDRYYLQCRLDAVQQYINDLATATAAVEKAESTKNQFDINAARTLVDLLSDGADKTNLKNRLDAIQNYLNNKSSALDAVLKAEKSGLQSDIDIALALVNQMPDGPEKTELLNRLNALQGKADNITKVIDAIEKAEKSGLQSDVDAALALMNQYNISNSSIKSRIDVIQKYINDLDLATAAVEKAERTKLQTDKNYAAPLVKAINDNLYAAKKANLSSRLDVVQNYINQLNDSTYGVVKSEITKTEQDATNAQTPIDKLPSATSENNIQDKINVPSTGTTDKDVLQDGLNNTTSYLEALNVATQAVVKAETSLSQADKNYAQNLADKLSIPSSNLQTRLSVVQKQIDAIAGATSMVELAENSKSQTDLNKAKTAVNSLVSCTQKTDLLSRVDVIQKYINDCKDATYLVSKAEISKNSTDIANAQTAVSNLADGTDKANLQGRLDVLKNKNTPTTTTSGLETATTAVEKAEGSYLLTDYNAAQTLVTSLSSSSDKTKLQSRLTNVKKVITQISTATTAVVSAEKYKTQTYISKAQTLVSAIVDCSQKNDLQNRLNSIQIK